MVGVVTLNTGKTKPTRMPESTQQHTSSVTRRQPAPMARVCAYDLL